MAAILDFDMPIKKLESLIDQYFKDCDEKGKRKYTWAGLSKAINIPRLRLEEIYLQALEYTKIHPADRPAYRKLFKANNPDKNAQWGHLELIEKAGARMQDQIEQSTTTVDLFRLKQAAYGGFADRDRQPAAAGDKVEITVKLAGSDGKAVNIGG